MEYDTRTVIGPRVATVNRKDALTGLQTDPQFPKGAILADFSERNGHWVAELQTPKVAGPFPPSDSESEDAPSGPPEGPPKDEAPDAAEPDLPEEAGPPKPGEGEGKEPKKPSVEESIEHLTTLVQALTDALGVGPGGPPGHPGAGPEADAMAGPPPPAGPGHAGPGHPPGGGAPGAMQRSRPLKPGDAPNAPGVTPIGAPAFANVRDDHPWKSLAGKTASFTVTAAIEDDDDESKIISRAAFELNPLAEEIGYKVGQVRRGTDDRGNPVVKALITAR